jgi:hypothetical protein
MLIEVSKGELIDKITILEIKSERVKDTDKLININKELEILKSQEFHTELKESLKKINETLWDIEDAVRIHEKMGDFGDLFIEKARSVYKFNDERCRIKRMINIEQGSEIIEEKSYA